MFSVVRASFGPSPRSSYELVSFLHGRLRFGSFNFLVRTPKEDKQHTKRLLARDYLKRNKLAAKGIDYDFPGFVATLKNREVAEGPFQPKPQSGNKTDATV